MVQMDDEGAGYSKRRNLYNNVKNFYAFFDLDLRMKRTDSPKGESGEVYPVTRDIMRRLLDLADIREKALIMLMKDSGLAIADIVKLRLHHLGTEGENLDREEVPIMITLRTRTKTRTRIQTFIGPETVDALNSYWDWRRRGTEHVYKKNRKAGFKPEELTGTSPVIRKLRGEGPLVADSLSHLMTNLFRRAGVTDRTAHGLAS